MATSDLGDLDQASEDILGSYLELQFDRVSKVEEMRLQFTSIVAGASVVAIAVLADTSSDRGAAASALAMVTAANLLAVGFILRLKEHVHQHEYRIQQVLGAVSPALLDLHLSSNTPKRRLHSINSYQIALHALLAVIGIGLLVGL
jgi:lysylphosphatidylglycerol synthetase-like protein (DUF2156 family)